MTFPLLYRDSFGNECQRERNCLVFSRAIGTGLNLLYLRSGQLFIHLLLQLRDEFLMRVCLKVDSLENMSEPFETDVVVEEGQLRG